MSVFGFLPSVGPWELILVLAIALIIFGPGKLPEVGRSLGKTLKEFKKASTDIQQQIQNEVREIPTPQEQPVGSFIPSSTSELKVDLEKEANKA